LARKFSQPCNHGLLGHGYRRVAEDAFEDGDTPADDDVIRHVLHDGGGFSGNQSQQHRSLVQVPEEEELAPENGQIK